MLGVIHGIFAEESALHRRFAGSRCAAEWFEPTDELLAHIASEAHAWDPSWDEFRDRQTIRVNNAVARRARVMGNERGLDLSEYVEDLNREPVQRRWDLGRQRSATRGIAPTKSATGCA